MNFKSDVDVPASMMSEGYLDISMPMYNALHYQPLFNWPISRSGRPEILSITVPNKWTEVLNSVTKSNEHLSTALRIAIDLAQSRDQFVWTLTILVAALNAYLPQGADLILRTVLNVRYDPTCVFPAFDSSDVGIPFLLVSDLPNSVRRYFRCGAPPNEVRKPRFGVDSAMGRRLTEDIVLLTELGRKSGLIEHFRQAADERKAGLENQRIPWFSPADSLADSTLALIGLLSQSPPWKIRSIRSITDSPPGHRVHFHDQCLYIDARMSFVRAFLCEMQLAGIVMDMIDIEAIDLAACSSNLDHIDIRFRDAWLESMTYADIVKSETWSPSAEAFHEWLHSSEMKGEIGGGEHDGVEVPCRGSDSGLLPPIRRPDDFNEFIPMFKTQETPERIKQKNNMKAFSGMIPKLSPGSMASIPTDFPHGGFHYEGQ